MMAMCKTCGRTAVSIHHIMQIAIVLVKKDTKNIIDQQYFKTNADMERSFVYNNKRYAIKTSREQLQMGHVVCIRFLELKIVEIAHFTKTQIVKVLDAL